MNIREGIIDINERVNPPIVNISRQKSTDKGSGVILIEMYKNRLAIILFRNSLNKSYAEGGGTRDIKNHKLENLKETAARELREESLNLFKFSPNKLHDRWAIRHYDYVGYFMYISGPIFSDYYRYNMKLLKSSHKVPDYYKETNSFTRVYIDTLLNTNLFLPNNVNVKDVYGNNILLFGRTKALIRKAIYNNLFQIKNGVCVGINLPITTLNFSNNYTSTSKKRRFLNGTKCYFI